MKTPELLSPAGSPEALDAAIGEGADAVYLGLKNFNARLRSANFAYSQFEGALRAVHRAGRKVYVAVNTVFTERETDRMYQTLHYLAQTGPDAVIAQDLGVLRMAREYFPALKVHASTQMNVSSAAGCALLAAQGVERAVLARELSAAEIQAVREGTAVSPPPASAVSPPAAGEPATAVSPPAGSSESGIELEVFVHGALCVSVSGLCFFSSFLGGKSANRGMCTQACRRLYAADNEQSGYYFSPRDLQLLPEVKTLAALGIDALKIEGRMKSADYIAAVTAAYRLVLDNLNAPESAYQNALAQGLAILQSDFARPKTTYLFYTGAREAAAGAREAAADARETAAGAEPGLPFLPRENREPAWLDPRQTGGVGIFLGTISRVKGAGEERRACVDLAAAAAAALPAAAQLPAQGDSVRFHSADDTRREAHKLSFAEQAGKSGALWISAPDACTAGDAVYLIQKKTRRKFYPPMVPAALAPYKRKPGFETAPPVPALFRKEKTEFPEGLIAAVSCIEDLYLLQSVNPAAVILPFNRKNAPRLLAGGLPFQSRQLLLSLESVVTCRQDDFLASSLPALAEKGFRGFVVNNLSQMRIFQKNPLPRPPLLIAGPYLYTFNRHAAAFAVENGAAFIISPLENSRQNLEKTYPKPERRRSFITVFCYPPLFRFRANVSKQYTFKNFTDSQNGAFRLSPVSAGTDGAPASETPDGGPRAEGTAAVAVPEQPFCITDKIPFLREAGFRHFIVDFTGKPLKKPALKEIWKHAQTGVPLRGASRFNWKNGFYAAAEPN